MKPMNGLKHTAIQILKDNLCHVFYNDDLAVLFDPADAQTILLACGKKLNLQAYSSDEILLLENIQKRRKIHSVFTTHWHHDHSAGNKDMLEHCEKIYVGNSFHDMNTRPIHTKIFEEGEIFDRDFESIGFKIEALYTPCHTRDSYCFYIRTNGCRYLVTGDTFFYLGFGKFFEGTCDEMSKNIDKIRKSITSDTLFLYGHDYRETNVKFVEKYFWPIEKSILSKIFLHFFEELNFNPIFNTRKIYKNRTQSEVLLEIRNKKDSFTS